jgi:hypothetical protein
MGRKGDPAASGEPLSAECRFFRRLLPELLPEMSGRYALIHDERLVGVFESEDEAIRRGFDLVGPVPFLVRQVPPTPSGGGTRVTPGR